MEAAILNVSGLCTVIRDGITQISDSAVYRKKVDDNMLYLWARLED
jgi:hypothetical protein